MAIFAAISVATAVTTTTLHIVQATKGCLYYPSVCTMRYVLKETKIFLYLSKCLFHNVESAETQTVKQVCMHYIGVCSMRYLVL